MEKRTLDGFESLVKGISSTLELNEEAVDNYFKDESFHSLVKKALEYFPYSFRFLADVGREVQRLQNEHPSELKQFYDLMLELLLYFRVDIEISLPNDLKEVKEKIDCLEEFLQDQLSNACRDISLSIRKVKSGSTIILLNCSLISLLNPVSSWLDLSFYGLGNFNLRKVKNIVFPTNLESVSKNLRGNFYKKFITFKNQLSVWRKSLESLNAIPESEELEEMPEKEIDDLSIEELGKVLGLDSRFIDMWNIYEAKLHGSDIYPLRFLMSQVSKYFQDYPEPTFLNFYRFGFSLSYSHSLQELCYSLHPHYQTQQIILKYIRETLATSKAGGPYYIPLEMFGNVLELPISETIESIKFITESMKFNSKFTSFSKVLTLRPMDLRTDSIRSKLNLEGQIFYHGTSLQSAESILRRGFRLYASFARNDFGPGLYVTDELDQALTFAQTCTIGVAHPGNFIAVLVFEVESIPNNLDHLHLSDIGEWKDFVRSCRKDNIGYSEEDLDRDIVSGRISRSNRPDYRSFEATNHNQWCYRTENGLNFILSRLTSLIILRS